MGTLFHHDFKKTLRLNFVQTNGVAELNSEIGRMLKDSGAGGVDSWDENGIRHSGTNLGLVSGAVFYWQAKSPDAAATFISGVNRNSSIAKASCVGAYFNGATGKIAPWNGAGGAGSDSAMDFEADTWYDFKLAAKTPYTDGCVLQARESTSQGDLPGSSGAWTDIGDTAAIHSGVAYVNFSCNLFSALAAGEYHQVDEFYHTTDGTFTTQVARASTEDTDTCDNFDGWQTYAMDGGYSIVGGALRFTGNSGNYGDLGWYRKVPQTTEVGAYFFFKFRKDSAAGGIEMIGLGDYIESNNFNERPALYYDSGKLYFYDGANTVEIEASFSGNTWYHTKWGINANGTVSLYMNKTGWADPFTLMATSHVAQNFNLLNSPVRVFLYSASGAPRTVDFDDYAYNPDGSEHPLYPNVGPTADAGDDQTVTIDVGADLEGSATDDGQPGPLTYLWEKVSGSGDVTFEDDTDPETHVDFSETDDYVLRLTASDGALDDTDEVTITVNPVPEVGSGATIAAAWKAKHGGRR